MRLLAFLLMLIFASSAFAESWVIWIEQTSGIVSSKKATWDFRRDIYDNRASCNAALPKEVNDTVKFAQSAGFQLVEKEPQLGVMFIRRDPPNRVVRGFRDSDKEKTWLLVENFYCFPIGLDPRER